MSSQLEQVDTAVSEILAEDGGMVTKWVLLAEKVNAEGETEFWSMTSPGISPWDRLGMLEYHARTIQPEIP